MDEKIEEISRDVCRYANSKMCVDGTCPHLWECPLDHRTIKALVRKGYRKESDTAREILTELKPIIINYLDEYMENGSEEAPKYFENLCKKYGVDLGGE